MTFFIMTQSDVCTGDKFHLIWPKSANIFNDKNDHIQHLHSGCRGLSCSKLSISTIISSLQSHLQIWSTFIGFVWGWKKCGRNQVPYASCSLGLPYFVRLSFAQLKNPQEPTGNTDGWCSFESEISPKTGRIWSGRLIKYPPTSRFQSIHAKPSTWGVLKSFAKK